MDKTAYVINEETCIILKYNNKLDWNILKWNKVDDSLPCVL